MMHAAELSRGFADPVHGAQRTFRVLLDAMARPGRVLWLGDAALAGLEPPPSLGRGCAATLLALLDAETSVSLRARADHAATRAWLRFHTGVPVARDDAAFVVLHAGDVAPSIWTSLDCGSDEAPQRGATLVIEVPSLQADPAAPALQLRGPGIEAVHRLAAGGLEAAFWRERIALQAIAPRGVDLLLTCGTQLAAIPRSTRLTLEH